MRRGSFPREEGHEVVEQREQRLVRPVVVALAPAGEPVVGVDGDDDAGPVLVARHEGAQAVDFHGLGPVLSVGSPPWKRGPAAARVSNRQGWSMKEGRLSARSLGEVHAPLQPRLHVDVLAEGALGIGAGGFRHRDRDVRPRWGTAPRTPRRCRRRGPVASGTSRKPSSDTDAGSRSARGPPSRPRCARG